MSDFSDDEDGPQGELQPKILTECVSDDSIKEESNGGDRPVPDMTTAGVGANSLDPNDKLLDQIPPPDETGIFVRQC